MWDVVGQILWFSIPVTPFITIPLVWKFSSQKKVVRILIGLALAAVISFFLFHISLAICFRNGLGPDAVY